MGPYTSRVFGVRPSVRELERPFRFPAKRLFDRDPYQFEDPRNFQYFRESYDGRYYPAAPRSEYYLGDPFAAEYARSGSPFRSSSLRESYNPYHWRRANALDLHASLSPRGHQYGAY